MLSSPWPVVLSPEGHLWTSRLSRPRSLFSPQESLGLEQRLHLSISLGVCFGLQLVRQPLHVVGLRANSQDDAMGVETAPPEVLRVEIGALGVAAETASSVPDYFQSGPRDHEAENVV